MPSTARSLLAVGERAAEDAADLTVEHIWHDHGYSDARASSLGDGQLMHVDTSAGRWTGIFAKTDKVEDVTNAAVAAKGLSGSFNLVHDAVVLEPVTATLVSFGLAAEIVVELVAV